MSIENTVRIIERVNHIAAELEPAYAANKQAIDELQKFRQKLRDLTNYLQNLDKLQPNYNTNDINNLINAINLHVDILKELLTPQDYSKLAKGMTAVKTMLKFHPTKYSFFAYISAWFVEFIYFI